MHVTGTGILNELPPMQGIRDVIEDDQDVYDIIEAVLLNHDQERHSYDLIVDFFYNRNVEMMAVNIFDFCKREIPYNVEVDKDQTVRTPAAILAMSGGDCKHYASFIGGLLDAANRKYDARFKWVYRFGSYELGQKIPGHVFVVVNPGKDSELWVDPVLDTLDGRYPWPYSFIDKKVKMLSKISGIPGNGAKLDYEYFDYEQNAPATIGEALQSSTGEKIGSGLLAVAAPLAAIPVVGWIAGAAAAIIGGVLKMFSGKKKQESESVRDLVKHYRINVKGMPGGPKVNSANVTSEEADEAQAFFSVVTGVPIIDMHHIDILRQLPVSKAVADYNEAMIGQDVHLTDSIIAQAADIVRFMYDRMGNDDKGTLQMMVAARVQTGEINNEQTLQGAGINNSNSPVPLTNPTIMSDVTDTAGAVVAKNPLNSILIMGALGWGVYEMTKPKKRAVGKMDTNQLLLFAAAGVGAYLLLKPKAVVQTPVYQQPYYQQPQTGSSTNVWDAVNSLFGAAGQYLGNR